MKLNESRLAVAAELQKKLTTLNSAMLGVYGFPDDTEDLVRLIRARPALAEKELRNISALVELMQSYFLRCCDLAGDLAESLERGTKCVLIPEPEPMPTGSEASPTDQRGGAAK